VRKLFCKKEECEMRRRFGMGHRLIWWLFPCQCQESITWVCFEDKDAAIMLWSCSAWCHWNNLGTVDLSKPGAVYEQKRGFAYCEWTGWAAAFVKWKWKVSNEKRNETRCPVSKPILDQIFQRLCLVHIKIESLSWNWNDVMEKLKVYDPV
jgi:hypothetical protein